MTIACHQVDCYTEVDLGPYKNTNPDRMVIYCAEHLIPEDHPLAIQLRDAGYVELVPGLFRIKD